MGLAQAVMRAGLLAQRRSDAEGLTFLARSPLRRGADPPAGPENGPGVAVARRRRSRATSTFAITTRFGARPVARRDACTSVAGAPAYVVGDRAAAEVVLLHGLPLDADSWTPVASGSAVRQLRADLPGLGRSASAGASPARVDGVVARGRDASRCCSSVTRSARTTRSSFAAAHPERVARLVLISPFFLQALPPAIMRWAPAPHGSPRAASGAITSKRSSAGDKRAMSPVLDGPAADLKRPGARARFGQHLADAHAIAGGSRRRSRRSRSPCS